MVAYTFKIDPVLVLKSDHFDLAVRTAAFEIVMEQREKANQRIKK